MPSETLFYIFGSVLVVLALGISFAGLRSERFPSTGAMRATIALFVVGVLGTGAFAVASAREEAAHREAEHAHSGQQEDAEPEATEESGEEEEATTPEGAAGEAGGAEAGAGGTLALAADPTQLAFDRTTLEAAPGRVTIEFENPAPLPHDVVVATQDEEVLARTEVITQATDSTSAELETGTYTFYCSVPGHREAGMEGDLQVR